MTTSQTRRLHFVVLVLAVVLGSVGLAPPVAAEPVGTVTETALDHLRWSRHYGEDAPFHDYGHAVAASADAIYVAVETWSPDSANFSVLRYSRNGSLAWAKQQPLPPNRDGAPLDIAMLPDGGVVATGYTYGPGGTRLRTIVLDPDGTTRWSRSKKLATEFGLPYPPRIAVGMAGTIYLAGSTGERFLAMTYGSDGERGWTRRPDPVPEERDAATSIAVDAAGNAYVTGRVGGGVGGFTTVRIRPGGKIAWRQDQQGARSSTLGPSFVAVAPDGRVVVSGVTESTCGVPAATTWSLDARHGTRDWLRTYPALPCDAMDTAGLGVRPDGSVVVVGSEQAGASNQGALVSYAADGTDEWVTPYGTPGTDLPTGLLVDGDTTYVTGMTDVAGSSMDVLTGAIERDGAIIWMERFDSGSSSERTTNLALVPGGDLVTAGYDWRPGPLDEVLVLSYRR